MLPLDFFSYKRLVELIERHRRNEDQSTGDTPSLKGILDLIHAGFMMPGADPRVASELSRYWSLTYRLLLERRP